MTIVRTVLAAALVTLVILTAPGSALAAGPGEQLNEGIQRVFANLQDPDLKTKDTERRLAVRRIANEMFDFGID